MHSIKQLLLALLTLTIYASGLSAQEEEKEKKEAIKGHIEAEFVSNYMWRGSDKGGISIQPQASIGWKGLSMQLSGSTGIEKSDPKEINVTLGYRLGGFNIGVTDYWTTGLDKDGRDLYFYFNQKGTAHQLEGNLGFSCRYFSLQAYTMFWGNDYKIDIFSEGKYQRAYSTYIELGIPFYFAGLDWDAYAGITPFESAGRVVYPDGIAQAEYLYSERASCVRASLRATKNFVLGDVKTPVFAEFHANPYLQKANFLIGVRIIPFQ